MASPGRGLLLRVNTSGSTFVTAGGRRTKQVKRSTTRVEVTTPIVRPLAGTPAQRRPASLSFEASRLRWLNDAAYAAAKSAFEGGTPLLARSSIPAPDITRAISSSHGSMKRRRRQERSRRR